MTTYPNQRRYQREPTLGDLFSDLSSKASLLVRQEAQLAKVEMSQKASQAGRELTLVAIGVALGNAALLALVYSLILLLEAWLPLWAGALLVGVILAIVAGILAWSGIQALKNIDPLPSRTAATLQENKEWITEQLS